MSAFIQSKRWELLLAASIPFITALYGAYTTGAFSGKDAVTGGLVALGIVLRAAASQQQGPSTDTPVVAGAAPSAKVDPAVVTVQDAIKLIQDIRGAIAPLPASTSSYIVTALPDGTAAVTPPVV